VKVRARLVSDNGPSYFAGALDEYLWMHQMPQTVPTFDSQSLSLEPKTDSCVVAKRKV